MNQDRPGKIRLGVIGIGNMGSEHCRNLLAGKCPETELCAVADPRPDRLSWAEESLPKAVRRFSSGSRLIQSRCCDAVLIAVPHPLHPALTLEALEAGLPVLCEKPAAVTAADARVMLDASVKRGVPLALMFNQRTNCVYRAMKAALDSGALGPVKRVSWIITDWYRTQKYYDSGSWRATWQGEGGGVLLNQCPHQLDLLIWLCGLPSFVSAHCHEGKWHHIEVEDDVTAYLEFPGGATGLFVASTGDLPGTNRLEIACDRGKLVCEDGIVRCVMMDVGEREICFGSSNPWYRPVVHESLLETDGRNDQHIGVINAFAAHLLRGEHLVASAEDGVHALELSNAIHLSGWLGRPVSLPLDEALFGRLLREKIAVSRPKNTEDTTYQTSHHQTGSLC